MARIGATLSMRETRPRSRERVWVHWYPQNEATSIEINLSHLMVPRDGIEPPTLRTAENRAFSTVLRMPLYHLLYQSQAIGNFGDVHLGRLMPPNLAMDFTLTSFK